MAELSPSGIAGLPPMTIDSLRGVGNPNTIGWLREAVQEGDRINRTDPSYEQMGRGMEYVAGFQSQTSVGGSGGPAYLPALQINESRRIVQAHASSLTDLQPAYAFKATNPAFVQQADLLTKLTTASWVTNMWDLILGDVIKYALCAGTGDLVNTWDPYLGFGGDISMSARDARDTLPWRPATHSRSIQSWEGLTLREGHSVNAMRGLFPTLAHTFRPTSDSLLTTLMGRARQMLARFQSPAGDTLAGLNQPAAVSKVRTGDILLYRTWLTDRTQNLTTSPIPMGTPGSSWAYVVPPKGYLYPYKRMILWTPDAILYDGPSTYWHGLYPVARLKLWDLPWHFLGQSILNDLLPLQDGINHTLQGALLALDKWLNPAVAYNRGAVSESFMRLFDPRRPGAKIKLNLDGLKEGFKLQEGPPPQVMQLALEMYQLLVGKMDDLSGTANFEQMLLLKQIPGADTIQAWQQAATPELRYEGRQIEAFLRDVAEQQKSIRFQYESNARRVTILGDAGLALEDFDFDPANLVPGLNPGDPGYQPEFDASKPRDQRAQAFLKTIIFVVAPNSILAMNSSEQKMMKFQLARMGLYDPWSLAEALDIPNFGAPPSIPLPPLNMEAAQAEVGAALQQPDGLALLQAQGKYILDPATGQILEVRQPLTVTERLIAAQQMGLGLSENPAGRKSSGADSPKIERKSDGRTTVTESRHDEGGGGSKPPTAD